MTFTLPPKGINATAHAETINESSKEDLIDAIGLQSAIETYQRFKDAEDKNKLEPRLIEFPSHIFDIGKRLRNEMQLQREFQIETARLAARAAEEERLRVQAQQPAPAAQAVSSEQGEVEPPNEPQRRLKRLREMGGETDYLLGKWSFKGIGKLVEAEAREGRPRSSQKTIKADLEQAAEAERKAKREGATASPFPI